MSGTVSVAEQLRQFLASKGEGPAQIAGIEANLEHESGLDPTSVNAAEGAHGLAQWEGGRWPALQSWAASMGLPWTSLQAQMSFLWHELTTSYPSVLTSINATNDPAVVARDWDVGPGGANSGTGFENSSGSTTQDRIATARSIYAELASGAPLTGGGPSGSGLPDTGASGIIASPANFPGGVFDPLNWPSQIAGAAGNAAGAAAGGVLKVVLPFLTKAAFVLGGLGLVIVGMYRASAPAREKVNEGAEKAAPLAAAAA
jgi:hypothetical protein